jgi:integrase
MASLLYGSGLRLMECIRLRVKDVDFVYNHIVVRDGKGGRDRVTVLPLNVKTQMQRHMHDVKRLHDQDLEKGFGRVYLPYALERKYPNADREWAWQYIFPATKRSIDPRGGIERRHHISRLVLQRAVKAAIQKARIAKAESCHTFRHSFATHLLEARLLPFCETCRGQISRSCRCAGLAIYAAGASAYRMVSCSELGSFENGVVSWCV